MATQLGLTTQVAGAFESAFGTAPGSGYKTLPVISNGLGMTRALVPDPALPGGRIERAPELGAIEAGGDVVVPLEAESIGHWLKAMFGAPATTGTDPYTHVFDVGASATLPSQAIEAWMSRVPHAEMVTGCVANEMRIEASAEGGGALQAAIAMIAQDSAIDTSSGAGTPADFVGYTRFRATSATLTRNGSALTSKGRTSSLTFANNLDAPRGLDGSGKIYEAIPGLSKVTGQVALRFADQTMLSQARAGTACELALAFASADGAKTLTVTLHEVYLPVPKVGIDGPDGVQATFDIEAVADPSTGKQATVTLVNGTASY